MSFRKGIQSGWNSMSSSYQTLSDISINDIHLSPFGPGNEELNLIPDVNGKKIIELGAGGLQNSLFMSNKGANVTAVDFSLEQLNHGQILLETHQSGIHTVLADISHLNFLKSNQFDGIISIFALEFIENIDDFFKSCQRLLNKNGWILISTVHPLSAFEWDEERQILEVENYFNPPVEIWKERPSDPHAVTIFRPISEIFNSITNSGFLVNRLIEPSASHSESPYKGIYWEPYKDRLNAVPFAVIFKATIK
tara:strand:+ start:281 stop:1036 length:756 start_codon:yes stop_codon:yes gene_type:complete